MRKTIKRLATVFYKPFLSRYLAKTRNYRYKNIDLIIPPEVFHPGFFFSTKLLISYISLMKMEGKTFLELGAGSGLIAIYAAKKNAKVTAIDINPVAVKYLELNSNKNNVQLQIIESDMFLNVEKQQFDIIVINPPYYKREPISYKDYAWYCGEGGAYFHRLFESLDNYIHKASQVLMILSEDVDLEMIKAIASKNKFTLDCIFKKKNIMEENMIYKIEQNA